MDNTWLVICNSSKAHIYHLQNYQGELKDLPVQFREHHEPELVKTFEHPESRMKGKDLITDKQGGFKADGAHGKYSEHHTPHQIEKENFAITLASFLELARADNKYQHLIICAEPRFYGDLKEHLHTQVTALIKHEIMKDYMAMQPQDLRKIVEEIQQEKLRDFK